MREMDLHRALRPYLLVLAVPERLARPRAGAPGDVQEEVCYLDDVVAQDLNLDSTFCGQNNVSAGIRSQLGQDAVFSEAYS